jgi:hypothetical protein
VGEVDVIEPAYLATLRRRYRPELVIAMVQLEQVAPGWWPTQIELAEQLGTEPGTLKGALARLRADDLLRTTVMGRNGGTWVWWVKRSETDQPRPEDEPAWRFRDMGTNAVTRIPVSRRWEWAAAREIPKATMQSFIHGYQLTLRNRWRVMSTPWDETGQRIREAPAP